MISARDQTWPLMSRLVPDKAAPQVGKAQPSTRTYLQSVCLTNRDLRSYRFLRLGNNRGCFVKLAGMPLFLGSRRTAKFRNICCHEGSQASNRCTESRLYTQGSATAGRPLILGAPPEREWLAWRLARTIERFPYGKGS